MTEKEKELLYDLLTKKALCGLDLDEQAQLAQFDHEVVAAELHSLEMTVAAINIAAMDLEPMPQHLAGKILEAKREADAIPPDTLRMDAWEPAAPETRVFTANDVFDSKPRGLIVAWLGWAAAAVAILLLGLTLFSGRFKQTPPEQARIAPVQTPLAPDLAAQREDLIRSAPDVITATFGPGNMKDMQVVGDIVWSDSRQQGYMRFRGIPENDPAKTCYQLWIFEQTQDKATPIDGGIFDVATNGEVIVPITAKLQAVKPEMFALTIERHGGVVVSKREKIAALAKVETRST